MSTAEFVAKLNRRHQAALCATLVCVGLILLQGGKVRDAVGISLLGAAFSWALGSNKRLVHWLFVILGLLLLMSAMGEAFWWKRTKPEIIKAEISSIEFDRSQTEFDLSNMKSDPKNLPEFNENFLRDNRSLLNDEQELKILQAEGLFYHVMKIDWGTVAGGLLLLSAGLGLIVAVKPIRQNQFDTPR